MRILSIETSCDETAISIIDASGGIKKPKFSILADAVASQISVHAQYGGVFPMMAKREHAKNIVPLFKKALSEAKLLTHYKKSTPLTDKQEKEIRKILDREQDLIEQLIELVTTIKKPKVDALAVTEGPGLEPALWVGINFAKALSYFWKLPVMPTNHMEGHIVSGLIIDGAIENGNQKLNKIEFPAIALLISGGHTQIVLVRDFMQYKILGETRDDAVGEAFDKVARMMGLPYPGGPQISKIAKEGRLSAPLLIEEGVGGGDSKKQGHHLAPKGTPPRKGGEGFRLPRPMLHTPDYDFSFSGLKTAVLYMIQKIKNLDHETKCAIACEFENAVTEVLIKKTSKAVEKYKAKTILLGGGVASNNFIKQKFAELVDSESLKEKNIKLYFPRRDLSTDNAIMIAMAGYFRLSKTKKRSSIKNLKANGNLKVG